MKADDTPITQTEVQHLLNLIESFKKDFRDDIITESEIRIRLKNTEIMADNLAARTGLKSL